MHHKLNKMQLTQQHFMKENTKVLINLKNGMTKEVIF